MRLLLDEMYPPRLADALRASGIYVGTVAELHLGGAPDAAVFAAAVEADRTVLTENVADFARLAADASTAGRHHSGVLIALSSRFDRRPSGIGTLVAAIQAVAHEDLADRVVYLKAPGAGL